MYIYICINYISVINVSVINKYLNCYYTAVHLYVYIYMYIYMYIRVFDISRYMYKIAEPRTLVWSFDGRSQFSQLHTTIQYDVCLQIIKTINCERKPLLQVSQQFGTYSGKISLLLHTLLGSTIGSNPWNEMCCVLIIPISILILINKTLRSLFY